MKILIQEGILSVDANCTLIIPPEADAALYMRCIDTWINALHGLPARSDQRTRFTWTNRGNGMTRPFLNGSIKTVKANVEKLSNVWNHSVLGGNKQDSTVWNLFFWKFLHFLHGATKQNWKKSACQATCVCVNTTNKIVHGRHSTTMRSTWNTFDQLSTKMKTEKNALMDVSNMGKHVFCPWQLVWVKNGFPQATHRTFSTRETHK